MDLLGTADNVDVIIDDPDGGEEKLGAPYLSSVTGRAIGDVSRETVAGRIDPNNRISVNPGRIPFRRGQV
jgi:hypothetical protein